jgi:hypothetical protein
MTKRENEYEEKFQEQEKTIQELAIKLEISIKREDEFREKDELRSLPWMKDVKVKDCGQCKKEFNALRRKHHCRRFYYKENPFRINQIFLLVVVKYFVNHVLVQN